MDDGNILSELNNISMNGVQQKGRQCAVQSASIPRPQEVCGHFAFFVLSAELAPDTVGKSDGLNGCTRVHSNIFHWSDPEWDDKDGTPTNKMVPVQGEYNGQ